MPIFRLPLLKRSIGPMAMYKCALVEIDGVGVYVQYDKDDELEPDILRNCIVGVEDDHAHIEADNARAAILKFFTHSDWEGARTGTRAKALEINRSEPILKYPTCSRLVEIDGWNRCKISDDDDYKPCDCVLDGADPPDDCPIDKFTDNIRNRVGIIQKLVQVGHHGEFLVVSPDPSYMKADNRTVRSYC